MQPTSSTSRGENSCAAVWAPWLAAPLFALLPIGGCGIGTSLRPVAAPPPAADAAGADGPVVPVLTAANRQVAWGAAAN